MTTKIRWGQISSPDGAFFSNGVTPPGDPVRNSHRLLLGLASNHNLATDGSVTGGSWLQAFETAAGTITEWDYFEDQSRLVSVSNGRTAIAGVSNTKLGVEGIGILGAAVASHANDYSVWGGYFDAVRGIEGGGKVSGIEVNAAQLVGPSPGYDDDTPFGRRGLTPYKAPVSGQVVGARVASGSDASVFGRSWATDAAVQVSQNGAATWAGLIFGHNAIMREGVADDKSVVSSTGYARAISMAHNQGLSWYSLNPSGEVGSGTQEEVFRLAALINDPAIRMGLNINDAGFDFRERVSAGASLFRIAFRADADAHLVANAAAIGGAPSLSVAGTNANMALSLVPKGTGWLHVPIANVREFADDAAAAAAGLSIGAIYRTGSALKIRAA